MRERPHDTSPKCLSKRTLVSSGGFKGMLLAPLLTILLISQGFGVAWWEVAPRDHPAQMWSKIRYDSALTDPFFDSNEWSSPRWMKEHPGGHFSARTSKGRRLVKDPRRLMHRAGCFSSSYGVWHRVRFCKAKIIDGQTIDVLIYENIGAFRDALRVRIRNGKFDCQYWGIQGKGIFTWTTTRQELTLDKKAYGKGDMIRGRIDFECLRKVIDPKIIERERWAKDPTATVKVFGFFKTVLE